MGEAMGVFRQMSATVSREIGGGFAGFAAGDAAMTRNGGEVCLGFCFDFAGVTLPLPNLLQS